MSFVEDDTPPRDRVQKPFLRLLDLGSLEEVLDLGLASLVGGGSLGLLLGGCVVLVLDVALSSEGLAVRRLGQ